MLLNSLRLKNVGRLLYCTRFDGQLDPTDRIRVEPVDSDYLFISNDGVDPLGRECAFCQVRFCSLTILSNCC